MQVCWDAMGKIVIVFCQFPCIANPIYCISIFTYFIIYLFYFTFKLNSILDYFFLWLYFSFNLFFFDFIFIICIFIFIIVKYNKHFTVCCERLGMWQTKFKFEFKLKQTNKVKSNFLWLWSWLGVMETWSDVNQGCLLEY